MKHMLVLRRGSAWILLRLLNFAESGYMCVLNQLSQDLFFIFHCLGFALKLRNSGKFYTHYNFDLAEKKQTNTFPH